MTTWQEDLRVMAPGDELEIDLSTSDDPGADLQAITILCNTLHQEDGIQRLTDYDPDTMTVTVTAS